MMLLTYYNTQLLVWSRVQSPLLSRQSVRIGYSYVQLPTIHKGRTYS